MDGLPGFEAVLPDVQAIAREAVQQGAGPAQRDGAGADEGDQAAPGPPEGIEALLARVAGEQVLLQRVDPSGVRQAIVETVADQGEAAGETARTFLQINPDLSSGRWDDQAASIFRSDQC